MLYFLLSAQTKRVLQHFHSITCTTRAKNKLNTQTTEMNEGKANKTVERKLKPTSLKNELNTNLGTKQNNIRRTATVTAKMKPKLATSKNEVPTDDRSFDAATHRDGYKITKGRGSQYYLPYPETLKKKTSSSCVTGNQMVPNKPSYGTPSKKETSSSCVTGNQMVRNKPNHSAGAEIGRFFEHLFRNVTAPMGQTLADDDISENDDEELLDEQFA